MQVRREFCQAMKREGWLDADRDPMDCVPAVQVKGNDPNQGSSTMDSISERSPSMKSLLYGDTTSAFFEKLLGGPVSHFDLTWFRAVAPGWGTVPHCDVVYMGRGTDELLTCWVPYGNISLEMGGLMILETPFAIKCRPS